MPITEIKELRILPPLAIGRFGSSPEPMDNYDAEEREGKEFRQLVPRPTLNVDQATGRIVDPDDGPIGEVGPEEASLRLEVGLHVAVEIEVVLAQVGESRHGEAGGIDPVHVEGV